MKTNLNNKILLNKLFHINLFIYLNKWNNIFNNINITSNNEINNNSINNNIYYKLLQKKLLDFFWFEEFRDTIYLLQASSFFISKSDFIFFSNSKILLILFL